MDGAASDDEEISALGASPARPRAGGSAASSPTLSLPESFSNLGGEPAPLARQLESELAATHERRAAERVEALFAEASAQCRVEFNATGYPEAVVFRAPAKTEVFTDRPVRLAATARARAFAEDFAGDFAGDPPNVAVTGWRKRKKGGWRRAYAVVTATGLTYDAAARELRYAVMQFPGQAGVTKGFRRGGEGGAAAEALRFCAGFVDDGRQDINLFDGR